ncbi:hypothetical protein AB0J43_23045 [Nonomuraea fuscirosea]
MPASNDDKPCQVCRTPLDVCGEQRQLTHERCCPSCSTRDTHAPAEQSADRDGDADAADVRADRALIRTLSDIEDGHLSLWIKGRFFDPYTGAPLDPPEITVIPDRQPHPGVPGPSGAWWRALDERGWLEMPAPGMVPMRYLVSEAGQTALEAARRAGWLRQRPLTVSPGGADWPKQHPGDPGARPSASSGRPR